MDKSEYPLVAALEEIKALKAQVNELTKALDSHVKTLDELYPSTADNIDGEHISEYMSVHGLIIQTKALISKAPLYCLNQVKADAIGEFSSHVCLVPSSQYHEQLTFDSKIYCDKLRNSNG